MAACGGEGETSTVTVTAPPPPASAGAEAPATEGAPTQTAPTERALPEGVVGADGTYQMVFSEADTGGSASSNLVDENANKLSDPETRWTFATECAGGRCTVQMRRELPSGGGFKAVTLEPAENRPGVYDGTSTGTEEKDDGRECPTRQRYSIRVYEPTDVAGRPTATRMDAYYTAETDAGCYDDQPVSGSLTWTGTREG
jgi:hypothetical protein